MRGSWPPVGEAETAESGGEGRMGGPAVASPPLLSNACGTVNRSSTTNPETTSSTRNANAKDRPVKVMKRDRMVRGYVKAQGRMVLMGESVPHGPTCTKVQAVFRDGC